MSVWNVAEKPIDELLKMVDDGALGLPQFQRPSVWGKANWIPFLLTLLLGRPTGTLLMMEAADGNDLAPRGLENGPQLRSDRLQWLLLDGQQRTTTLYCAARSFFGKAPVAKKIVVDVKSAIDKGELLEEHFTVERTNKITSPSQMASNGKACFETFLDSVQLEQWRYSFVNKYYGNDPADFVRNVNELAPKMLTLSDYRFPVLQISRDTPIEVVADIFEGMNRRGQPLNKFDLMVARLYRPDNSGNHYNLRDEWGNALSNARHLRDLGVDIDDGMLPLQVIAKQVAREPEHRRGGVKGLTSGSVLELPPSQVIGSASAPVPGLDLLAAVEALDDAAHFLKTVCGVVSASLLPQQAMLIPLADQFLRPKADRLTVADLKKWFFSVGLRIDYYGSVNSYADRDCNELETWLKEGLRPDSVASLTKAYVSELNLKQAFEREGSLLGRTIMALLVSTGALDWSAGQVAVQTHSSVDLHHMVPEQRLKQWYPTSREDRKSIASLTPVSANVNKKLGNLNAADVVQALGPEAPPIMSSHAVDISLLTTAWGSQKDFEAFRQDREKRLKNLIITSLAL